MRPWTKYRNHPAAVAAHLDDPKYKCCGCCHVQTGTICLGVYNLVTQILAISVLTFAILHPEVLLDNNDGRLPIDQEVRFLPQDGIDHMNPLDSNVNGAVIDGNGNKAIINPIIDELPTPLPQKDAENAAMEPVDQPGFNGDRPRRYFYTKTDMLMFTKKRVQSGDAHLALALVFGLLFITLLLVYGAVKGRPVYLLPFFCFQVFDFILACLTAVGHYTWLPNIHEALTSNPDMPFREHLLRLNSQWVALCVLLIYVSVLIVKAYFVGVVWSCYQFLHARNAMMWAYGASDMEQLLVPPDYESATKMPQASFVPPPMHQQPPPGYSSA